MSEQKHTDGPWEWHTGEASYETVVVRPFDRDKNNRAIVDQPLFGDYRGHHICSMSFTGGGVPTREAAEANAEFICRAANANQKLIDSLQFLVDAAQSAVKATPGLSVEETKLIGAIELARVTLALAKDDEEAGE